MVSDVRFRYAGVGAQFVLWVTHSAGVSLWTPGLQGEPLGGLC